MLDGASDVIARAWHLCGATYSTAPNGAACDSTRIQQARGLAGLCLGPRVGDRCYRIQVAVAVKDQAKVPQGFVCGSAELGVVTCLWTFGDAGLYTLDVDTLNAACAATIALPEATVFCVLGGS